MVKTGRYKKAERFRAKGSIVLNDRPLGIGDFLDDFSPKRENAQIHKTSNPHMHTPEVITRHGKTRNRSPDIENEALGRLHLQIRQDLIEKVLNEVFERKRNPKLRGRNATQRSVIEDALEYYFRIRGIPNEVDKTVKGKMESG